MMTELERLVGLLDSAQQGAVDAYVAGDISLGDERSKIAEAFAEAVTRANIDERVEYVLAYRERFSS